MLARLRDTGGGSGGGRGDALALEGCTNRSCPAGEPSGAPLAVGSKAEDGNGDALSLKSLSCSAEEVIAGASRAEEGVEPLDEDEAGALWADVAEAANGAEEVVAGRFVDGSGVEGVSGPTTMCGRRTSGTLVSAATAPRSVLTFC